MKKFLFPRLSIKLERWKYYKALDIYVSNMGQFKNANGETLSVCKKNGYLYCKGKAAHRIVMEAWKPINGYANLTVDHKNHNTWDNRLSNLEWVTIEENKQRDKNDIAMNAPKEKESSINIEKMIMLNANLISIKNAKEIIKNDKTISGNANIDRAFQKAIRNPNKPIKFGGYSITYIS